MEIRSTQMGLTHVENYINSHYSETEDQVTKRPNETRQIVVSLNRSREPTTQHPK